MDPDSTPQIIAVVVFLLFSAFFSAAEAALKASSKQKLKNLQEEGARGAKTALSLLETSDKLLSSIMAGSVIADVALTVLITCLSIQSFGNRTFSALLITAFTTVIILAFGKIAPKSFSAAAPEKIACALAPPLFIILKILSPINAVFSLLAKGIRKITVKDSKEPTVTITEEELKTIVSVSEEEGVLEPDEKEMIHNVFDFGDSRAKDVMVPRTDIAAISVGSTYNQVTKLFQEEQFSRIPVYQDDLDNIIGILYVKDLLCKSINKKVFSVKNIMRKVYFSYEQKPTSQLFAEMRTKRIPMTIIIDEYGGTAGLVTLEDLVEEIVGDINDEYDLVEEDFTKVSDNLYSVDGSAKIDDFNEATGLEIESDDYETIGGFVLGLLGHMPEKGECAEFENVCFTVEETDKNRIQSLKVEIKKDVGEEIPAE